MPHSPETAQGPNRVRNPRNCSNHQQQALQSYSGHKLTFSLTMRMMDSNARRTCTATDPTPTQAPSPCPRPRSPHCDARPLDSPSPRPCCHDARGSRGEDMPSMEIGLSQTHLPWRERGGVPNPREHRGLAFHGERAVTGAERAGVTIRGGGRAFHGDWVVADAASMEGSARSWKVGRADQG
jgi:hypothetical protein